MISFIAPQQNLELFSPPSQPRSSLLSTAFCLRMLVRLVHSCFHFNTPKSIPYSYSHSTHEGAGGLGFLQFCNLNSFRTKFILAFSVFMGFSIPQYFNEHESVKGYGPVHTHARWVISHSLLKASTKNHSS